MELKKHKLLSLLLAAALLLTAFPATASAADVEEHNHAETVADLVYDIADDATVIDLPVTSGMVGESFVAWDFDETSGRLTISGSGGCEDFRSADDQPWAAFREEIIEVRFSDMGDLSIENLAHWFEGCTNLISAEIPYTTSVVGANAFAGCGSLTELYFYYNSEDDFEIISGAFSAAVERELSVYVIEDALEQISSYDWASDNRIVAFYDVYTAEPLVDCTACGGTGTYNTYECLNESSCKKYVWCANCDSYIGPGSTYSHMFSNNTCRRCGYTKACSHSSSYTSWSGCDWYEYCSSCSALLDSGTTHGTYSYGAWSYYSSSQHRSYYACEDCGEGSYVYASHSTTISYTSSGATQHTVSKYCSTCGTTVSSSTASHSFSYGSWSSYSASQHYRAKTCSSCGYSTYEYASHSLTYGSWTSYSATQHRRAVSCSCGYSAYEYGSHSITNGTWSSCSSTQHQRTNSCSTCSYSTTEKASHTIVSTAWECISATQHSRTNSCSCGYSTTENAAHSFTYGDWGNDSDTQHRRNAACSCGYSTYEYANHEISYGDWNIYSDEQHYRTESCSCGYSTSAYDSHADGDGNGYCDSCNYEMTRFSVTVPANLVLTVSKNGKVYAPTNAAIVNNSTGTVAVKSITVTIANGWTLVPYSYNMAQAKVDSKLIGFSVNDAETAKIGSNEALTLSGNWQIAKGASLSLDYGAVISASSAPINQQVLTIVFVVDWA